MDSILFQSLQRTRPAPLLRSPQVRENAFRQIREKTDNTEEEP